MKIMFSEKVTFAIIFIAITLVKANNAAKGDNPQDAKCLLPVERGPCHMNLARFYYDAKTDTCEKFIFGGCMGNDNKFGFKQTCEQACKKSKMATTKATTASTAEQSHIKSDTNMAAASSSSTTTLKPAAARTTLKTLTSTATKGVTVATQNSKRL